jgi:AcrR family transcriptional regulator
MDPKHRILEAAALLYAQHGFRGATTRLIAEKAGVNEVTIFRTFGSKEALIGEAIRHHAHTVEGALLPAEPLDPELELSNWCRAHLTHLRNSRSLIRTCMGELEDRPELAPGASEGPTLANAQLTSYLEVLRAHGRIDETVDLRAAAAMFLGVCFADAMGRDLMPDMFPSPEDQAASEYTRLFARAIGLRATVASEGQADGDAGTPSLLATPS